MDYLPSARQHAENQSRRLANWMVGLTAAALVLISVGDYYYHREQLATIAAEHLRLIVAGPSSLSSGVAAEYIVSTTTIGGGPLPAEIEVSLLAPGGARLKSYKETADRHGRLRLVLPADLKLPPQTQLKVVARHGKSREEAQVSLSVQPAGYSTRLALDRPLYRPGETVYYRLLTLSRLSLAAAAGMAIHFEVRDPRGDVAPDSQRDGVAERGVGGGEFKLPADAAEGCYTLVARSADKAFPEERKSFFVRRGLPSKKESPASGEEAEPRPPEDSTRRDVVLTTGADTFAAAAPLEFTVVAAKAGLPLVVAAYCDGVQVGQQSPLPRPCRAGDNRMAISLDGAIGGEIRLIAYDYSGTPPQPVAGRSVYRRPARELNVRVEGLRKQYAPGDSVDLSLLATDERGRPVKAVFGVSAIGGEAVPAAGQVGNLSYGAKDARSATPPWLFDNLEQLRSAYEKCFADYRADRAPALNTLTTVSLFGGLGLVLLVAMLGLMRIVSGIHLLVSAIGATTCCLIVGAILMDSGRLPPGQDAIVRFSSYTPPAPAAGKSREGEAPAEPAGVLSRSFALPGSFALPERRGVREPGDFAETLLWRPLLVAGADGKASISFKLPEGIASFGLTVDAHGDGRVGYFHVESNVR